ncbi:hypothetical protein [Actinomadura rudentiformis]|uniref:Uncharacterized protein n=1 Tax=Actinomadura rudentiformis TaxID=359158 RepID=A0A6H9YB50_9ACTN|nr:hypothetical protein [Actinomadura rudentiformis]KAB2342481.1 hypothetical protein F8566_38730 [Actinomadura rudentiformis]
MKIARIPASLAAGAAIGTAVLTGAGTASAATTAAPAERPAAVAQQAAEQGKAAVRCGKWTPIKINGGYLRYRECTNGIRRWVAGNPLNDTKNNNRCVWAKVKFVPWGPTKTYKDCGGAPTRFYTGAHTALDARVTLS